MRIKAEFVRVGDSLCIGIKSLTVVRTEAYQQYVRLGFEEIRLKLEVLASQQLEIKK